MEKGKRILDNENRRQEIESGVFGKFTKLLSIVKYSFSNNRFPLLNL